MELSKLLISYYLPYGKYTIVSRAIPGIDGLKPVQRRIMYSMNQLGLSKDEAKPVKSVKVVGDVMGKYHPHGDSSIYEAIVGMSNNYEGFNVAYIKGKGSFGKVYSRDLKCAAPRYTEVKMMPICKEFFDGIKENSVDIVPNFDGTEKEPVLLPVKFPSILVNASAGVAVGTSSNIPSFSLVNVCKATIDVLEGRITDAAGLAKVLGAPEFTTGGFLHADDASLEKLCATGKGSFTISGRVQVYSNKIVIDEIPYCTTAEDIMDAIDQHMKDDTLKGVKTVQDEIGLDGLRLVVELKSGYNSREVLRELCRLTPLRSKISFRTRVIINNRCKELSLLEVIDEWIKFRIGCIKRINQFRLDKYSEKEHLLSAWDLIKDDIAGVVQMIAKNTDAVAKQNLISSYGLDDIQAEYLLDMKIRSITKDKAEKSLKELADVREKIEYCKKVINDESEQHKIIISDLNDIMKNYGTKNKTILAPELTEDDTKAPEIKISDELTTVVYTRDGYVRRLTSTKDIMGRFTASNGDEEVLRWTIRNNQHLLVFDRFGIVHKVLVDDIDQSRGKLTDELYKKAGLEKKEDMIYADACGDYTGYFNLIYPNGRGTRVLYSSASGNRKQYKGLYSELEPGHYWITKENQFFMVTHRNKAAYCDITRLGQLTNRTAFKVARVSSGDWFTKLIPYKDVPSPEAINLDKYNKDYTVSIGDDSLWVDDEEIEAARKFREKLLQQYKENEKSEEDNDKNDITDEAIEAAAVARAISSTN